MKKKTLDDIAQMSGYSKSVVSRVLNGKAKKYRISEETVQRILRLCEKVQYRPNFIAQQLRNQTSRTIGLIVPHLQYTFFGRLSSTIIAEAYKHGYLVSVVATMDNPDIEAKAISTMIRRQLDGIIISPNTLSPQILQEAAEHVPLIQVDRYLTDGGLSYISTDSYEGARMAMRQLIDHGHRRVLCLKVGPDYEPTKERVRGTLDIAREEGVEVTIGDSGSLEQMGYVDTMLALNSANPPTAIFTLNNFLMLGVLRALNEMGLHAPADISLISFDDSQFLNYTNPPITRVVQPVDEICTAAVKVLTESIEHGTPANVKMLMAPSLVMRDSIRSLLV